MGHLNSFLTSRGGNLNKNFSKIQMPGELSGGGCLSSDLTSADAVALRNLRALCCFWFFVLILLSNDTGLFALEFRLPQ